MFGNVKVVGEMTGKPDHIEEKNQNTYITGILLSVNHFKISYFLFYFFWLLLELCS